MEQWAGEPVVCVVNGIMYSGIQLVDTVALVGAGDMGLLFVQGLSRSLLGTLTALDVDERRLAWRAVRRTHDRTRGAQPSKEMEKHFDVVI